MRRPFTLIWVLYVLYGLAVNFTRTSSFCAGRVFIQPIWSEHLYYLFNLYRPWRIFDIINYVTVKLLVIRGAQYCYFFLKAFLHWISFEIETVNRHALSYVLKEGQNHRSVIFKVLRNFTDHCRFLHSRTSSSDWFHGYPDCFTVFFSVSVFF